MKKTVFITFADRKLMPTLKRIGSEAKQSGFFDVIHTYDERIFGKEYWRTYGEWYKSHPRGFGYWLWKPYLIRRELQILEDGDILVYLDAGCVINSDGAKRFQEYLTMVSENGIVCFEHNNCYEKQYSKADLLQFAGKRDDEVFLQSRQLMSGIIVIQKSPKIIEMVEKWYCWMHENFALIDDSPSQLPENPEFKENRHDQSVFSILSKEYGAKILPQGDVYPTPCDWSTMQDYPFWAARRKVFAQPSLTQRIINKVKSVFRALIGK